MPNITENVWNSTRGSGLYCVWVPAHDDPADGLVAIWIDPALTAFKSCSPETLEGIDSAAAHFAGHQEENVDLSAGEHLSSILPPNSH